MTYTIQPHGVCSRSMTVETDDQGVIQKLEVVGGCGFSFRARARNNGKEKSEHNASSVGYANKRGAQLFYRLIIVIFLANCNYKF